VIGPRLTTQFGLKTRLPKICSREARIKWQTPAAMAFGTSAWQPIYLTMLAQQRDVPVAQSGEGAPRTAPLFGALFLEEFVRERA
jgi:hypothetical protein